MRVRFRFAKLGKIRFTGQRDVARMWERAFRRAGLPVAYTEGFSPRPQLSFGLALPTGAESLAEYLDVVLDDSDPATGVVDIEALPVRLGALVPSGIFIEEAVVVEGKADSLQQMVDTCRWTVRVTGAQREEVGRMAARLLDADAVMIERERKGRKEMDDLRPSVLALCLADEDDDARGDSTGRTVGLIAELATRPRGVRPAELVAGLVAVGCGGDGDQRQGGLPVLDRACRTHQWIERDGLREEPLRRRVEPVRRAAHAQGHAS